MSKPKKAPEKDYEELVDFDVIRENWHVYELEDDTIVRTRNTLMSIIDAGPLDEKETGKSGLRKIGFGMKILHVVHSPKHLRSSKGKVRSISELEKFIVQPNLKFRQIKDGGNSEYRTKKNQRQIIISTRVKRVDKTSKHDQNGMPAYIIRIESEILIVDKPEKKQKETKT
jgi:hypothetical protein